jgi:hypothetical protein
MILCDLVASNPEGGFNKLIVLQSGATVEAALTQIIYRAQNYNREGVPNIREADRRKIAEAKADKFAVAIDVLKKYKVLDGLGANIYSDLHRLRKFRNKVHIQEDIKIPGTPRDEDAAFTDELAAWALTLNRTTLQYLSEHLARPAHIQGYVSSLTVPN